MHSEPNNVDCCTVVYAGLILLEFYLLNSSRCIQALPKLGLSNHRYSTDHRHHHHHHHAVIVAGAGEVWERAKSLQEKMQANLQMAKDRLDVLGM